MIQSIEEALEALGVTADTLDAGERRSIDELGYVVFENAIPLDRLETLRAALDAAEPIPVDTAGRKLPHPHEKGALRHTKLEHASPVFEYAYTHPKHLAAVYHILKSRFVLATINGRDPLPGEGHQAIHRDAGRTAERRWLAVQSLWMLDEFAPDNGATRIVPGTHHLDDRYREMPKDTNAKHPEEILVCGPAGSITVINSHLWHGGTANRSTRRRRTLHSTFVPVYWDGATKNYPHAEWITQEMYDAISPAARFLLGLDPLQRNVAADRFEGAHSPAN